EALEGIVRRDAGLLDHRVEDLEVSLAHRDDQRVSIGEVEIDRGRGDTHGGGDGPDRHRIDIARFEHQPLGRVQQVVAQLVAFTAPTARTSNGGRASGLHDDPAGSGTRSSPAGSVSGSSVSLMPMRSWIRRIQAGAHQFASPAMRMKAGTSVARITNASISTAMARPTPKILMNETPEVAKAMKTTLMSTAAAVTIRPVRSRPRATECVVSWVRSCSSLMRESKKTS